MGLTVFYFGNEYKWNTEKKYTPSKRRSNIFYSFHRNEKVGRNYLVNKTGRAQFVTQFFINLFLNVFLQSKTGNVAFTVLFPDRMIFSLLNKTIARIAILIQSFPASMKNRSIIWCYWPYHYDNVEYLGLRGSLVFDVDHNILDDPNTENRDSMERRLLQIGNASSLILAGAPSILNWLNDKGLQHTYRLRNGVAPERFKSQFDTPKKLLKLTKPIIGYCGVLSKWIDYQLFYELVERCTNYSFVVIGDQYKVQDSLLKVSYENLLFTGKLEPNDTPAYISNFDVALGLYRDEPWLDVDSMKIYEYLAAGVPVVSTRFHVHLEGDFEGKIYIADTVREFMSKIEEILSWTSTEKELFQKSAKSFTNQNTWEHRVEEVVRRITDVSHSNS